MLCSIPSSTKIFNLATALFLFILVGFLCLSVNLLCCQECTFYCTLWKKRCTLLPDGTDKHIQQHIHEKDLNLCLRLYYYGKVLAELENNPIKEFNGIPEFLDSGRNSWTLDSGRWTLDAGLWTLDAGLWTLDAGLWTVDAGLWTLDATLRKLGSGH